jgi:hypothetical protein
VLYRFGSGVLTVNALPWRKLSVSFIAFFVRRFNDANLELQERCCTALMECSAFSSDDLLSADSQVLEELSKF